MSDPMPYRNITSLVEILDDNETGAWMETPELVKRSNVTGTWEEILPAEFKEIVPKHWLQFRPPAPEVQYTLGALYILIMMAGAFGNASIIWLFCTTKALRTPSNFLVLNLAVSDFLMTSKMTVFIYNSFTLGPMTGIWWCQLYGAVGGLSGTSAIMSIAAMAVERYISISRPLDPSSRMTKTRARGVILGVWIYSFTFSIPPLVGLNRYVPEGFLSSCSFDYLSSEWRDKIFIFSFFVAAWCVPLVIVCSCYVGIVLSVRQSQNLFQQHARRLQAENRNLEKQRKMEIRLAKISFCLISLWTLSWTPYATVALMGLFTDRSLLTPLTSMVPALFCKMASVLDPYVYGLSSNRFKAEIKRRIFRRTSARIGGSRSSAVHVMRTLSQDSHGTYTSGQEGEEEEEEEDDDDDEDEGERLTEKEDDYCEQCTFFNEPHSSVQSTASSEHSTAATTQDSGVDGNINHQSSVVQVKNIKIFYFPQVCDKQEKHDEIKIQFRRSI